MSRSSSLVFCQVLVKLHVSPYLAPLIDGVNIKLGRLDLREVKPSKDARRVMYQAPEGPGGCCETHSGRWRQMINRQGEKQGVGKEEEQGALLDLVGQHMAATTAVIMVMADRSHVGVATCSR